MNVTNKGYFTVAKSITGSGFKNKVVIEDLCKDVSIM